MHLGPGPSPDSTAVEVARLAVLKAVDHLVVAALLQSFVTPPDEAWPARRLVAVTRVLQDALIADAQRGTSAEINALWARLDAIPKEETP